MACSKSEVFVHRFTIDFLNHVAVAEAGVGGGAGGVNVGYNHPLRVGGKAKIVGRLGVEILHATPESALLLLPS